MGYDYTHFTEVESISLHHADNMSIVFGEDELAQVVYADMIYESRNFDWIDKYWDVLAPNGVFIVQTDYHTAHLVRCYLEWLADRDDGMFIAEVIYKQEWGGVPKKGFPIKHDNIYIYAKGKDWKWHGDRIQIPKATAGTKLDKKGTGLKTPCSVFDDLGNFSTLDKERVKVYNKEKDKPTNVKWQKPMKLMDRLLLPFTDEGDLVIDPFLGSGTTGEWCKINKRRFIGIELDDAMYEIARKRIFNAN